MTDYMALMLAFLLLALISFYLVLKVEYGWRKRSRSDRRNEHDGE